MEKEAKERERLGKHGSAGGRRRKLENPTANLQEGFGESTAQAAKDEKEAT
jgi:hypothetical protein